MKKIIGIIVIILMIPFVIYVIGDIDRTPIYPTTDFNIEKLTRISSIDINNIELPKLPNGVGDRLNIDGSIERKVGKIVITNDTNVILQESEQIEYLHAFIYLTIPNGIYPYLQGYNNINNLLSSGYVDARSTYESFYLISPNYQKLHILKSRLVGYNDSLTDIEKAILIKNYLISNNFTIYYQLATSIIENTTTLPEFIDFYDGGSVIVDDGIVDYTVVGNQVQINYIEGNITTVVDNQFIISKPTKIISKSNDLYDYDLSTLPNYLEYGTLLQGTYDNVIEFINNNQNKQIKIFYDDNIQENRYNIYQENDTIIINNDTEVIRIYNDDTYTSTRNLDTDITYKLEGYNIIDYIDGEFDNTVLAFFWIIPVLLAGGLIYLLIKRKE